MNFECEDDVDVSLLAKLETQIMKNSCVINGGLPSELLCTGYKVNFWKRVACLLFIVCTGGLGLLIFYWKPDWWLKASHVETNISSATSVLLETSDEKNKQSFVALLAYMPTKQMKLRYGSCNYAGGDRGEKVEGNEEMSLYFLHQSLRFIWNRRTETFIELGGLDKQSVTLEDIFQDSQHCMNEAEVKKRFSLFGPNVISVEVPNPLKLLVTEILNPFYVFQAFSCILWYMDDYEVYATVIVVSAVISALVSLYEVRSSLIRLHNMVEYHNKTKIQVMRNIDNKQIQMEVWSRELVPGDVIIIPPGGLELACDASLVSGICIVNESMLTGESVPVTKIPLPSGGHQQQEIYSTQLHKSHTLFCGTRVLQTRYYADELVKAVVVRTGYQTAKGRLVHSILYPKPLNMRLLRDAYRFVAVLCVISFGGFIYTAYFMAKKGESIRAVLIESLTIVTIAIPPALPVAMTIGIVYAQRRLSRQKVNCISSQRINVSGQVDVVAFDKTGTLTEDGLDLYEILPTSGSKFAESVSPNNISDGGGMLNDDMLHSLATCHTLTTIDGELRGDPLDLILFQATGWKLFEPEVGEESQFDKIQSTYVAPPSHKGNGVGGDELGIVRCFPFESSLQRASVIIRHSTSNKMMIYMKGSPEMITSLCLPNTIPRDFNTTLKIYTQQGYRMIAMACKQIQISWLKAQKIERSTVEQDLHFLGLVALQNKLKPQSKSGLEKLQNADIRTLMVTGDNLLTALSVAREAGMIGEEDDVILAQAHGDNDVTPAKLSFVYADGYSSATRRFTPTSKTSMKTSLNGKSASKYLDINPNWHLAVTGSDFANIKTYFPEWMEILAVKGTIFARMSPDQKTELIEELDDIGHHICMCGDGANDCGALKRAHVGISLSEYEASVAAPFTSSLDHGIECVPLLIREGRAALVTSFGMFKFMALYSIIQFSSVIILYSHFSSFSDFAFLYIDLVVIDLVVLTMSRNYPCKKLYKEKPVNSLISMEMLTSLLYNCLLQFIIQLFSDIYLNRRCWYNEVNVEHVNETVFNNHSTCSSDYDLNFVDQSHIVDEEDLVTYNSANLLYLSVFIYLSTSITFSQSFPFRTRIYKNKLFFICLVVLYIFNTFILFWPPIQLLNFLGVRFIPELQLKLSIIYFGLGHFVMSLCFEMLVVERPFFWNFIRKHLCQKSVEKFEQIRSRIDRGLVANPTTFLDKEFQSGVCRIDFDSTVQTRF